MEKDASVDLTAAFKIISHKLLTNLQQSVRRNTSIMLYQSKNALHHILHKAI